MFHDLLNALEETLFMIFSAGLLSWFLGLPLGTLLSMTGQTKCLEHTLIHRTLRVVLDTTGSVPYLVLMIAIVPFTRFVVGIHEGSIAAIVPLTLAAVPQFAQFCEKAINRVPKGLIEAAQSLGASPFQIAYKILIPEALSPIIKGFSLTLIQLIGYSTIAGAIGAGGLGGLIIEKGHYAFYPEYVLATLVTLVVLVYSIQLCGDYIAHGTLRQNKI